MESVTYTAAGCKRFYAVKLDQLKARDNQQDGDSRPGLIHGEDGFQAAYVTQDEAFAFVTRLGSRLEFGVYTPGGPVQAGTLDPNGESTLESNLRASGLSSGRHSDYTEVTGYSVSDDNTRQFAERTSAGFSVALDEAFVSGHLSQNLLK
jgi:hypothetical protein